MLVFQSMLVNETHFVFYWLHYRHSEMDTDSAPRFRRNAQGELLWRPSPAAQKSRPLKTGPASSALAVEREALRAVRQKHLPTEDKVLVLGHHCLQFGKYQGHSFKWLLENALALRRLGCG